MLEFVLAGVVVALTAAWLVLECLDPSETHWEDREKMSCCHDNGRGGARGTVRHTDL